MKANIFPCVFAVILAALAADYSAAVDIPLTNNSFEDFTGATAINGDGTLGVADTDPLPANGRILTRGNNGDQEQNTIPGWQIFRSSDDPKSSQPIGFDDDKGGFDGARYAYGNEGLAGVVWSDAVPVTFSEGDWITVTWSVASDNTGGELLSRGYLNFGANGTADGANVIGQTGQGGATRIAATARYDNTLAGSTGGQVEAPELYQTFSRTLQLTAAEADAANANGVQVGVYANGLNSREQWRIDNVFLDQIPEPAVTPVVLMDNVLANGSFEDVTGGSATNPFGSNNTGVPTTDGAWRLATATGGGEVTIPGWLVTTNGVAGFDNDRAPSDGNLYAFGNQDVRGDGVISDAFGISASYTEGDVVRVSYDQARNNDTESQGFNTFLGFDGGAAVPGTFIGRGEYDVSLVGDGVEAFERETLLYTLTADDAAMANLNGLTVRFDAQNASSGQWRLDNVLVELLELGVETMLDGDYNDDGVVNIADYTVWRDNLGAPEGTLPNDPNTGIIDADQYDTWKNNFGASSGSLAGGSLVGSFNVPEPATVIVLAASLVGFGVIRRKRA